MYFLDKLNKNRTNFFSKLDNNKICAEIGVRDGQNAYRIYNVNTPKELYLIDPWETLEEHWSGNKMTIKQKDNYRKSYENTYNVFKNYNNVFIKKKLSVEASLDFEDEFFDWVYIDGDHRYEHVINDLLHWYPKVKTGGHIAGHDYTHDDIKKAIKLFLSKYPNCKLICAFEECGCDGNSDFLIKKN